MSDTIRTAVVGYGLAGRVFHSPFIEASREYSLDVIVTSNPDRVTAARREHPLARVVPDFATLLQYASDLDLVVVGTPPESHFGQASSALLAGLAVVVDKPFVLDAREGEQLARTAEEVGRPLAVFQNRRWDGDFLTVRRILDSGVLGNVYQFESSFEYWGPTSELRWHETTPIARGGGVSHDLGSHLIDQALVLFGPVESVASELRTVRPGTSNDDVAFIELTHAGGVRSQLRMNRLVAQPGPRFRVLGSEGAYVSYGLDGQEPALAAGISPTDPGYGWTSPEAWGRLGVDAGDRVASPVETERGDYPAFYAAMADAIRGVGPVPVGAREALEVTRILEAVHAAVQ